MKVNQTRILLVAAVVLTGAGEAVATLERPYEVAWIRQLGGVWQDVSLGVSADGLGNVYTSGYTVVPRSRGDAFVGKYDSGGNLLWTDYLGTSRDTRSRAVSADRLGHVYISGYTQDSLGGPNAGGYDAFVSKYDSEGNVLWIRQFGTGVSDEATGVSADGLGNVYVSGFTFGSLGGPNAGFEDAFVSKYDSAGNLLWTRQFGTMSRDSSLGVSADALGNAYVSGRIDGYQAGRDYWWAYKAFVSKYNPEGNLLWTHELSTGVSDESSGVSVDGLGSVYVCGTTTDWPGAPYKNDALVSKCDSEGILLWTRQLGTRWEDCGCGVSADELGNVYISGMTWGSLDGPKAGATDAFVSKYNSEGDLLWTRHLGTEGVEWGHGISVDRLGSVFISGYTSGSLGGPNAGGYDAFVAKLVVPEPGTVVLLGLGGLVLLRKRRGNYPSLTVGALSD